jgi:alpha-tubulin suppressor-like RCC1 family protein
MDVSNASNPSVIACGSAHACAIGSGFWCWGADDSGQVGDGKQGAGQISSVSGPGVQSPVAVAAGLAHTCAISSSGAPFCWGANESGQLGAGNTILQTKPAAVSTIAAVQRVAAGSRHSCAQTTATGAVYCWGNNSSSQLAAPIGGTFLTPRLVDGR